MRFARWTRRTRCFWQVANGRVGYAWWMNAVARSCRPRFFPQRYWNQVAPALVQEVLRAVFARWGRPEQFRVDNGTPWGSAGDWPTDLALWLIGLGVGMIWNRPRRPQDNGVVERSQGTGKRWVEPQTCRDPHELQQRLDEMDRIQREVYPSIAGQSRLQAFPGLQHSQRPYNKAWEQQHWDLELVLAHLAEYSVLRHVDRKGQVSLYNRNHYVGKQYSGRDIYVMLDPIDREWVFSTPEGTQLRRKVAEEISQERILKLQVTHRR
jgi:transposase InsO family protein